MTNTVKGVLIIGVLLVIAVLAVGSMTAIWGVGIYNNIQVMDEAVKKDWSNVLTSYQRRNDLLPNLAETVKGYAQHENSTFKAIADARAKMGSVQFGPDTINSVSKMQNFQAHQGEISSLFSRLMVVMEKYPDLKANVHYSELMAEVSGTENRISFARQNYNDSVQSFNSFVKQFPNNIINGMFAHYELKIPFEADKGAEKAPKLNMTN